MSTARCVVVFKYVQLPCFYDSHQEKEALNTIHFMISETETLDIWGYRAGVATFRKLESNTIISVHSTSFFRNVWELSVGNVQTNSIPHTTTTIWFSPLAWSNAKLYAMSDPKALEKLLYSSARKNSPSPATPASTQPFLWKVLLLTAVSQKPFHKICSSTAVFS